MAARALLCAAVAVLLCAAAHSAVAPATGSNCVNNTIRYSNSDSVNGIKFVCFANSSWTGETPVACMHQSVEHLPGTEWVFDHFVYSCNSTGPNTMEYKSVMCALPSNDSVHFPPGQTIGGFQCWRDSSGNVQMKRVAVVVANCTYGNASMAPGTGAGASGLFLVYNDSRTQTLPQIGVTLDCVANKASADMNAWGCAVGVDLKRPLLGTTIRLDQISVWHLPDGDGKTYTCVRPNPAEPYVVVLKEITGGCLSTNGNTYSPKKRWANNQTVFECQLNGGTMTTIAWGCVAADGSGTKLPFGSTRQGANGVWKQCWHAVGTCTSPETSVKQCFAWRDVSGSGGAAYCNDAGVQMAIGQSKWTNGTWTECKFDSSTGAPKLYRSAFCSYTKCRDAYTSGGQADKCTPGKPYEKMYMYCYRSVPGDGNSAMWVDLLNEAQYMLKYPGQSLSSSTGGSASGSGGNLATTTASSSATTSTANLSLQKCYSVPANQPTKDYAAAGQSCALAAFHAMSDYDKMVADSAGWSTPGARVWIDGRLQDCGPVDPTTAYMRGFLNGTAPECLAYDIAAKGLVFEQCAANMHYVCEAACAAG